MAARLSGVYGVGRFLIEFLRNDYRGSLGIFPHHRLSLLESWRSES
ncbi:MAG: hypothetical protein ACLR78_06965 [Roseburia sp.]